MGWVKTRAQGVVCAKIEELEAYNAQDTGKIDSVTEEDHIPKQSNENDRTD